jgi:hypothetical protein
MQSSLFQLHTPIQSFTKFSSVSGSFWVILQNLIHYSFIGHSIRMVFSVLCSLISLCNGLADLRFSRLWRRRLNCLLRCLSRCVCRDINVLWEPTASDFGAEEQPNIVTPLPLICSKPQPSSPLPYTTDCFILHGLPFYPEDGETSSCSKLLVSTHIKLYGVTTQKTAFFIIIHTLMEYTFLLS